MYSNISEEEIAKYLNKVGASQAGSLHSNVVFWQLSTAMSY
jgi:hypothetical protein